MRILVHIFIVVIALSLGATGYFALAFTPIEAGLSALVAWGLCILILDRNQRRRSEARLEKAIDDLSRLLSTDAQAGQVLSQRINELAAADAENRLAVVEADISVLGTVVRQVAEAMNDLESALGAAVAVEPASANARSDADDDLLDPTAAFAIDADDFEARADEAEPEPETGPEPLVSLEKLQAAISDGRLVFHMVPIVTLPQRKSYGFDLVPRLKLEDGDVLDAPDFMPRRGGGETIRDIEWRGIEEAVMSVRRAKASGSPVRIMAPISRSFLADAALAEKLLEMLDANLAVARSITLRIAEGEWRNLGPAERVVAARLRDLGVGFSLTRAHSLRLDFDQLSRLGVASVRVDAGRFVDEPASLTDYHSSDIADYVARFEIDLIGENVTSEQQLLSLLEDGVKCALGPHIGRPAPIRPDLLLRRDVVVTGQRAS